MKCKKRTVVVIAVVCLLSGFMSGVYVGKSVEDIPFVATEEECSIGIYKGKDPFHFIPPSLRNSILTAQEVTNIPATFVADPLLKGSGFGWNKERMHHIGPLVKSAKTIG